MVFEILVMITLSWCYCLNISILQMLCISLLWCNWNHLLLALFLSHVSKLFEFFVLSVYLIIWDLNHYAWESINQHVWEYNTSIQEFIVLTCSYVVLIVNAQWMVNITWHITKLFNPVFSLSTHFWWM